VGCAELYQVASCLRWKGVARLRERKEASDVRGGGCP
jgi:hypothetical protein